MRIFLYRLKKGSVLCGVFFTAIVFVAKIQQCSAQSTTGNSPVTVIPLPVSALLNKQSFSINSKTIINMGSGIAITNLLFFNSYLKNVSGLSLSINSIGNTNTSNVIRLKLDSLAVTHQEGYNLNTGYDGITLTGHDEAGIFYGLQTLIQLMQPHPGSVIVPGYDITDSPRFKYRGMHLDVSRHMFPVSAIKKWINTLALYKINTFHWHLTDDQGWRIEIKKFPGLQNISAYRNETLIGHKKELPHRFDGVRYGGYYTQDEARDIVRYAAERHIRVIPEIEMPGHALAVLAAYPELGCTGGPYQTASYWGVFNDVYCAGNEKVFSFLEGVLDEIIQIFPSEYIHIGGDECPKEKWKTCPKCQKRMEEEHLQDEHQLQSYFIKRISKYLASRNRRIIGWDEILEGGLVPGSTVMSWTGEQGGIAAARQHHDVVMTPEKQVYLDYYQSLYATDSLAAGGYLPLSKVYQYEPVPTVLTADEAKYIIGIQANVWSEYLPNVSKAEYMIFPRMLALAEVSWSPNINRNFHLFLSRLENNQKLLQNIGINSSDNYKQITDTLLAGRNNMPLLKLRSGYENAAIHYTTDGSQPTYRNRKYRHALLIQKSCTIKARLFKGKISYQDVYNKQFVISKATGKKVVLESPATSNYNPVDPWGLVNGTTGSDRYNDGQWFGFSGRDLLATVDLGTQQRVSALGINILNYHWQKMWPPVELIFSASVNGIDYQEVYRQTDFPVNGINTINHQIIPVKARYIKIKAVNRGIIPNGEYGAGGKALLLVDQLLVR